MNWERKVDHHLLALWNRSSDFERSVRVVRCFVKLAGAAPEGMEISTIAGDIATCSFVLSHLPVLAGDGNVIFIEKGQLMYPVAA